MAKPVPVSDWRLIAHHSFEYGENRIPGPLRIQASQWRVRWITPGKTNLTIYVGDPDGMAVTPIEFNGAGAFGDYEPTGSLVFNGPGTFDVDGVSNQPYELFVEEKRVQRARKAVAADLVLNGMTPAQARTRWGDPDTITKTGLRYGADEEWIYGNTREIYFRRGTVLKVVK